jgi:hypothetical protein
VSQAYQLRNERRHMINDALKRKLRGFPTSGLGLRVVTA